MKRYQVACRWAGCIAALVLAAQCGRAEAKPATKEEIAGLFDQWNAALATGKPAEVVKLYATDAILVPTVSDKVRTNHAEIEDYFDHFLKYKPVGKIDEQYIRLLGDTAINAGTYTFSMTDDGKPTRVRARYTFVYAKQGGKWMIVEHHSSMMPEGGKGE